MKKCTYKGSRYWHGSVNYVKSRLVSNISLKPPLVVLCTYTGEALSVLGKIKAKVEYKDQSHDLAVVVVKGDGSNLYGRDWLSHLKVMTLQNWTQKPEDCSHYCLVIRSLVN